MTITEALRDLGVRDDTLTPAEKSHLDEQGYLPLPGILSPSQVLALRSWLDERLAEEAADNGKELGMALDPNDNTLADLVNKSPLFEVCFTHPRVLAGIAHVLDGDLKLSSLNFRAPNPGHGLQPLHADWGEAVTAGNYQVCNSIWLVDDFTEANGPTRVIPGSNRWATIPQHTISDPSAAHPDEVKIIAEAGTVVIFNSHTWHGGTLNESNDKRRAMHSYFCRRSLPQQLDQARFLRPETRARLSEAALTVLGV